MEYEIIDARLAIEMSQVMRAAQMTAVRRHVMDLIKEAIDIGAGKVTVPRHLYVGRGTTRLTEADYLFFEGLGYTVTRPVEQPSQVTDAHTHVGLYDVEWNDEDDSFIVDDVNPTTGSVTYVSVAPPTTRPPSPQFFTRTVVQWIADEAWDPGRRLL